MVDITMARSSLRVISMLLAAVAAVLVLSSCQAQVQVAILVDDEPGEGTVIVTVELDREAIDRLEGVDGLRTADLEAAGWTLDEAVATDDGGVVLGGRKPFSSPAELASVLTEVSGPEGPYARLGLWTERSFARTTYRLEGVLDGSVGVEAFRDPGLAEALDGLAFGVDLAELEAELGAPLGSFVDLSLAVALPGDREPTAAATYTSVEGIEAAVWETDLAAADPVPVLVASEEVRVQSVVLVGVALALGALFLLILLIWAFVRLRRRRRRRKAARRAAREAAATPRPIAVDEAAPEDDVDGSDGDTAPVPDADDPVPVATGAASDAAPRDPDATPAAEAASPPSGPRPPLQLVVIGGPGAAFGVRDLVDDVVAFARARGSMLEYPKIAEQLARAEVGEISTAELWMAIGAEGDPRTLDEQLLGQYQLAPGLRDFVIRARERGYRVAYLGDGPEAWAHHLRRSFVLEGLIDPMVVSGAVGARMPDQAMFDELVRAAQVESAACLLIDDRLRILEAAHQLGFGTAWFSPTGRATEAPGHSIIRGFADLLSS